MNGLLDVQRVAALLQTRWLGRELQYQEVVDSTNLKVKELAGQGAPGGSLCAAEVQTAGRGRRGRSWHTPGGEALAMSFLLYPDCPPCAASMLSLVAGLSVAQGCRDLGLPVELKWPNDVVLNGRKICGILTEMQADTKQISYVVVGIGINVNLRKIPEEIAQMATSFYLETGKEWEREAVMAGVLNHMEENYETFLKTQDLSLLKASYEKLLVNRDRQVRIEAGQKSWLGTARGITATGELLVEKDAGQVCQVAAGEVSVRGLYGYV